ncbi:two-component system response regulator RR class II (RRII)-CheY-LuxR [Synechococcus sp. PROS-7-1]|uniref:response regulator transcription factor n=1 Tax=Synechococcus sp. PROS-7-1 TaxID=1442556 RepID=UPI001647AACC|nr:response regulator transcription factor [Synechococcus sp. PROS-7-1]QNI85994.1 two-component system response regulator RR class II (RRII)-CheY-LuxR [Synechococcus sp. PROS-7-1]
MDLSSRIPSLQQQSRQGHSLLRRSQTAIATADPVLLASWTIWFEGQGPLVAACTSEDDCLSNIQSHAATLLLCTDLLESGSGISLVRRALAVQPELKALILLHRPIARTILDAIEAGCHGICAVQSAGTGAVAAALTAVDSDGQYLDPLISGVLHHSRLPSSGQSLPLQELTMREEDVLRGLCRGMSNEEIANDLLVSMETVKSHVSSLLRKLPAKDRTAAVVTAFREGLVQVPARPPRWT